MHPLGALAAGLVLVAVACSSDSTPTASGDTPEAQRVVFVGISHDIATVRADGTDLRRIAGNEEPSEGSGRLVSMRGQGLDEGEYTWPTWSPDGTRLALSRVPGLTPEAAAALLLIEPGAGEPRTLYETAQGGVLVAQDTPHYIYWSPDSRRIAFIAPHPDAGDLALYYLATDGDGGPFEVARRAPMYFQWSPDGSELLIHRGEQLLLHDAASRTTEALERDSPRYRVPAFNSDGTRIAYVADLGQGPQVVVREPANGEERAVLPAPGLAAFAWSPTDPGLLAVALAEEPFSYTDLSLLDVDGEGSRWTVDGPLVSFFWAPDGQRIAVAAVDQDAQTLRWDLVGLEGNVRSLAPFIPSPEYATLLSFFDQFAPSHRTWSADSTRIVFTGAIPSNSADNGPGPRVWVLAVADGEPTAIARGRLAFWVPPGAPDG